MPNTFPTASTTIRALKRDLGIEAIPAHHIGSRPGVFVANGLLCTFGPSITVRTFDRTSSSLPEAHADADAAEVLRESLTEHGWDLVPAKHQFDRTIVVNSIPRKRNS